LGGQPLPDRLGGEADRVEPVRCARLRVQPEAEQVVSVGLGAAEPVHRAGAAAAVIRFDGDRDAAARQRLDLRLLQRRSGPVGDRARAARREARVTRVAAMQHPAPY
jgi:hypothetical protein